jgi:hypothetical protein
MNSQAGIRTHGRESKLLSNFLISNIVMNHGDKSLHVHICSHSCYISTGDWRFENCLPTGKANKCSLCVNRF